MSSIQTEACATFWRGDLRCSRVNFDTEAREHNVVWVVGGEHGVATFLAVHTVHAPQLTPSAVLGDGLRYEPWLLARHTLRPINDDDGRTDTCEFLDGLPCYIDTSGMAAVAIFEAAVEANLEEVIWIALETYYRAVIEEAFS
jgi:hypothetical protein